MWQLTLIRFKCIIGANLQESSVSLLCLMACILNKNLAPVCDWISFPFVAFVLGLRFTIIIYLYFELLSPKESGE